MIQVLTGQEIHFDYVSRSDLRLTGNITIKNTLANQYQVYKLKSTNNSLFQADPYKGILKPHQTAHITVTTADTVNADYARQLAQKNKFMIQYISLPSQPNSFEEAQRSLKRPEAQHIKIFINTNRVRGGDKVTHDPSVVNSRYSFHSLGGEPKSTARHQQSTNISADHLKKLNDEVYFLENQRTKLVTQLSTPGNKGGKGLLKPLVIFIVGLVAGNLGNKHLGITEKIESLWKGPQPQVEEQQGFFSIFNTGGDQVEVEVVNQESEEQSGSWWNIF